MIVCGDNELNPGPILIGGFGSSILIFVVFMPMSTSCLWQARSDYYVWVCAESKVSDRRYQGKMTFYISLVQRLTREFVNLSI